MIEVFKTNIKTPVQALSLEAVLKNQFAAAAISFDLEDCDNILRIDGISESDNQIIIETLQNNGFWCEVLD